MWEKKRQYKQNPTNPFILGQNELTKPMPHGGETWKKIRRGENYKQQLVGYLVHFLLVRQHNPTAAWKPEGEKQTLKSDSVVMVTINFAKKDHKNWKSPTFTVFVTQFTPAVKLESASGI